MFDRQIRTLTQIQVKAPLARVRNLQHIGSPLVSSICSMKSKARFVAGPWEAGIAGS